MAHETGSLFSEIEQDAYDEVAPLAVRMRPRTLDEFCGQQQAVGPGTWLRQAIEEDTLTSIVIFGPAGTGKTTLAGIIAAATDAEFVEVSAVSGTVGDLRREIAAASERLAHAGRKTILFIDEIHRFSRSQQDALLH
ncbi:MAG: AAA family ATPase, partial [Coriobacteriales bacterium]